MTITKKNDSLNFGNNLIIFYSLFVYNMYTIVLLLETIIILPLLKNVEQTVLNNSLSFDIWLSQKLKWPKIRSRTSILNFHHINSWHWVDYIPRSWQCTMQKNTWGWEMAVFGSLWARLSERKTSHIFTQQECEPSRL